ncbi:MAG: helix-turn-helix transcriptional regulator [Lachnospiraceae bacterium]|nr:helix-turn-helix transcriptional regulator [Lachnospiraceae bacterium]
MYYENYQKIKESKNVKDRDVAKATGIDPATFSHWKKGLYTPKEDKLTKIASYLNISVDELKGISPNKLNSLFADILQKFFKK